MHYVNEEIIKMIDAAFPENVHLGRYVVNDKVVYGFDHVSGATLSNLVEILVFDVKEFTFKFNEDTFFQQTPEMLIPQLIGKFDSDQISKIISEFMLRRDEFLLLKEKCVGVSGEDLFNAIDALKPVLHEIYKNDPFNPSILEKKVEDTRAQIQKQSQALKEQISQEEEEPKVDWFTGIIDIISMLPVLIIYYALPLSKLMTLFVVSLLFLQGVRCYPFIVNLLKWLKFKRKDYGK